MRIKEEFKKSGYFWLPSSPESKIPGTLSITDGGDIELEVIGLFDENIHPLQGTMHLKRIIGHVEIDGLVTLDDCFYKKKNFAFGGISKSLIRVKKVFSGVAYDDKESVLFNKFLFSIEGIDQWVGISGIEVDNQFENHSSIISYHRPEEILLNLNNGMQLLIKFFWTFPGFSNTTEAKITQKTYFQLVSKEERELNDFISLAYKITTFLCFAVDKTVCLDSVTATSDRISQDVGKGKTIPVPIRIYYPSLPFSKEEQKIELDRMLFRFGQIQNVAERIVNNWIDAYDQIDSAINLYFSTKTGAHKYINGQFLALVQGLETYHRRISDEKIMKEEKFKELVKTIVGQCPEEHKEWLEGRLRHGNEINLGRRIKRIIEPFKDVLGTSKERNKIIRSIVDTRNYLTHYDEELTHKAASGKDLWSLCLKMEAFFQLHFLQVLGFTQSEIKSILDNSEHLKQKLKGI